MLLLVFLLLVIALSCVFSLLVDKLYAVSIVSIFYVCVVAYSVVGLFFYEYAKEVPWGFYYKVDDESLMVAALIYSSYALALALGALLFGGGRGDGSGQKRASKNFALSFMLLARGYWPWMVLVAMLSPVFLVVAFGIGPLWHRVGYDMEGWDFASKFSRVFLPVSSVALIFIPIYWLRWILFLVLYAAFFSLTSRAVVLVPFFYFVAFTFFVGKISLVRLLFCSVFAVVGAVAALDFRLNVEQGLIPNLSHLFFVGLDASVFFEGFNYIFSYSLTYLAYMVKFVDYDSKIFWISLNPLPGGFVDIEYISEFARVAPRIPYSAVGEVFLMLGWSSVLLFLLLGGCFARVERYLSKRSLFFCMLFVVFVVFFGLMSTQYNLRGAARLVYYAFFVYFLYFSLRFSASVMRKALS